MSGITLDDIANNEVMDKAVEMETLPELEFESVKEPSRFNEFAERILTAETGNGSIGDYIEHPMNFNQSKGLARILRGLTGIIGNLNLAIIDVGLGVLEFSKEKKGLKNYDVSRDGGFPS